MGQRDYGPIPYGLFDDDTWIGLDWPERGMLLGLFGICSFRGRFPRNPVVLARKLGSLDAARVDELVTLLVSSGAVVEWEGSQSGATVETSGRRIKVGAIVGYSTFAGLPKDRKYKLPKTPEFPDPPSGWSPNAPPSLHFDSATVKGSKGKGRGEAGARATRVQEDPSQDSSSRSGQNPKSPPAPRAPRRSIDPGKRRFMEQWGEGPPETPEQQAAAEAEVAAILARKRKELAAAKRGEA